MDEPTLPSTDAPDTDPGGHAPPASSPPDLTLRQLGELVLGAVSEQGSGLRRALEAHQRDELEHHRRVDGSLTLLVEHVREQGTRLAALERRVAHLEARAPTEPPTYVDASEPGGES